MLLYFLFAAAFSGIYYTLDIHNLLDDDISDIPVYISRKVTLKTHQTKRWERAKKLGRNRVSRKPMAVFLFISLSISFYCISILYTFLALIIGTLGGYLGGMLHENISYNADKERLKELLLKNNPSAFNEKWM